MTFQRLLCTRTIHNHTAGINKNPYENTHTPKKASLTFVERLYCVRWQPLPPIVAQVGVADRLSLQGARVVVAQHREHELAAERVYEQISDVLNGHHAGGRVLDV